MSLESKRLQSPSDILITSMEGCDDIATVAVLSVLHDGTFVVLTNADPFTLIGMAEIAKTVTFSGAEVDE